MMKRKFMQRQVQKLKTSNITKTSTNTKIFNKSLLRYPGGKSRGAKRIFKEFIEPQKPKKICSPFLGGGSVEIICANNEIEVFAYDAFESLVIFWNSLLKQPIRLAKLVEERFALPLDEDYKALQKSVLNPKNNEYMTAALFYIINRTSFSGSTLSGGRTPGNPRFTVNSINNIINFNKVNSTKNFHIEKLDFRNSIKKHKMMMYLDPPYWKENKLYGNNGDAHFTEKDHIDLAKILKKSKSKWVLSYNDNKKVRNLYPKKDGFHIHEIEWSYGMKNVNSKTMKKSDEIIITNFLI